MPEGRLQLCFPEHRRRAAGRHLDGRRKQVHKPPARAQDAHAPSHMLPPVKRPHGGAQRHGSFSAAGLPQQHNQPQSINPGPSTRLNQHHGVNTPPTQPSDPRPSLVPTFDRLSSARPPLLEILHHHEVRHAAQDVVGEGYAQCVRLLQRHRQHPGSSSGHGGDHGELAPTGHCGDGGGATSPPAPQARATTTTTARVCNMGARRNDVQAPAQRGHTASDVAGTRP